MIAGDGLILPDLISQDYVGRRWREVRNDGRSVLEKKKVKISFQKEEDEEDAETLSSFPLFIACPIFI